MPRLFADGMYQEISAIVMGSLILLSVIIYPLQTKSSHLRAAWASLKSWIFVAPFMLVAFGLPSPWPLILLVLVAVFSSKIFFQMVGIYHRSWFVGLTYLFLVGLGLLLHFEIEGYYDLSPMIFFASIALIPLMRNSVTHMIQYMALTLMCFIFFGWSLMHWGRLLLLDNGVFIVLYLYILTEVSDSLSLAGSRLFGRFKIFNKISPRFSVEGLFFSLVLTVLLAWGLRHLLPHQAEQFWVAAGVVAAVFGRFGDLILTVIRRDLGIKETGVFIIGRGDLLSRTDKLIVVGPMYYYIFLYLRG